MPDGRTELHRSLNVVQQDPVTALSARWGQTAAEARRKVESLVSTLRELDQVRDDLAEHGLHVDVDLGPVGDAARAARRDLEKVDDRPKFSFPAPR